MTRGAVVLAALGALSLAPAMPAWGASRPCLSAAEAAAARHGVPAELLRAIALVETGRGGPDGPRPWPWAINAGGRGAWFESRAAASAAARRALAAGTRSIDIGCFQINLRWHGDAFESIDAMFDPAANADYAARFLARLHREAGDWTVAAGWYHSRTPELSKAYRERLARHLRDHAGGTHAPRHAASPLPRRCRDAGRVPRTIPAPGGVGLGPWAAPAAPCRARPSPVASLWRSGEVSEAGRTSATGSLWRR
jgi:hypothetical protein